MSFLIIIVAVLLLMWVFLIRPQRRKQAQQQHILETVSAGDEILTAGGFYGTVRSVDGDEVRVEIAPGTEVRLARRAVAAVIPPESEEGAAEELEGGETTESTIEYGFDAKDESTAEKRS